METTMNNDFSQFIVHDDFTRYGITPGTPKDEPTFIQLELTDTCNLRCPNCPRAYTESIKNKFPLDMLKTLIKQIPSLEHICFVGAGETLLVKDLAKYVSCCKEKNIFSSFTTNGLLIKNRLKPVVEAGLNQLQISIDTIEPVMLDKIRPGVTLAKVDCSLESALKITANTQTKVLATITLGKPNISHFPELVTYLCEKGIKHINVESFHHWNDDHNLNVLSLFDMDPNIVINYLEQGFEIAQKNGVHVDIFDYNRLKTPEKYLDAHCPWPWDAMYVTSQGNVTPCCINLQADDHNTLGNVFKEDISTIWHGEKYTDFRAGFVNKDKPLLASCKNCIYRMEFGKKNDSPAAK